MRLAVLACAAALTGSPLPASGSCAAPFVTVVERGELLEVTGRAFVGGSCQDSCSCAGVGGCQRCDCGPPPEPVARAVVQLLGAQQQVLAEQEVAVTDGAFTVELPAAPATVTAVARGSTADGGLVVAETALAP